MYLTKKTTFIASVVALATPLVAFAQYGLDETAKAANLGAATPLPTIIGRVISTALGLVGVIFLILMIYGGYLWMIARGNDELVEKAKDIIRSAIIGVIIVAAAYAITFYFVNAFTSNPVAQPEPTTPAPTGTQT